MYIGIHIPIPIPMPIPIPIHIRRYKSHETDQLPQTATTARECRAAPWSSVESPQNVGGGSCRSLGFHFVCQGFGV